MPHPSTALLVAGMHRSGTSFLGESCGVLGYALPRDAGEPARDNPRGHFEPRAVVALNDRILSRQGAIWLRVGPAALPDADAAMMAQMDAAVAESFGAAGRIMVKDPRLSLTLPLWRAWAEDRGIRLAVLIALRDPREVAHSLARRNGIAAEAAMLSWIGHNLAALAGSEGLARLLVPFPGWTHDPAPMLARIAAITGAQVATDASARVTSAFLPDAVHGGDDGPPVDGAVGRLALDLFDMLSRAADRGGVPPAAALAHVCQRFDAIAAPARAVEQANAAALKDSFAVAEDLRRDLAVQKRRLVATEAQRDESVAILTEQLQATEAQRDESIAGLIEQLARTEAQRDEAVAGLTAQLHAAEVQRTQTIAALTAQVQATEAQRDQGIAALTAQLHDTEAQRDEGIAALTTQLRATEVQRDEGMAALTAQSHETETQRESAAAALAMARGLEEMVAATEAQRDEMTDLADQRLAALEDLQHHVGDLQARLQATEQALASTAAWLERERNTILKPVYRRLYRFGGRTLRRVLPSAAVDRIKRGLPVPGGIPRLLAFPPVAAQPHAPAGYGTVPARRGDKADIFILSIINWDFRIQRPQHLAVGMAAEGHRVFYIEMEQNLRGGSVRGVAPGVQVVRLPGRGLRGLQAYTGVPTRDQARAWVGHFHDLADAVDASPVSHVVIEHPYWWNLARHLSPQYQITFDCMDDIGGFSNTEPHVLDAELDMIARADKMVVSSQYLHDRFSPMRDVAMIRNGADVGHFIRDNDAPAPAWLSGRLRPGAIRVGYVGAIAEWFHADLLDAVARDNPDFDIHLCGAVTAERPLRLGELPNVTLHGEIPYADVPAFHQQMDVLIIPFQLLPIIKACDPVKFYEYSAIMRPTVSTSLPELDRAGDLVFRADDPAGFGAAIRRAAPLARDAEFGRRLRQYARDNAWSFRATDMLAEMRREPRLSVVVLHYGADTDMTLATLHAMLGQDEVYPNLEVLLVDNGSAPEVLDILRDRAAGDDRIRLIENGENLGFARGNNRGIAAATGDYVLLLNNDTFLAPGALLAMVRHLQRNPDIGIVGPLTNNIGNEARVEIAYADMDQMIRAARDLGTGHRGRWTPITVCAYFCAMFRRADLDRLGDLPEIYGLGMFEDDDHCASFRKAGLKTALAEDAFCHHHLSASFDALPSDERQRLFRRNRDIFESRWGAWVPHRYRQTRPADSLSGG